MPPPETAAEEITSAETLLKEAYEMLTALLKICLNSGALNIETEQLTTLQAWKDKKENISSPIYHFLHYIYLQLKFLADKGKQPAPKQPSALECKLATDNKIVYPALALLGRACCASSTPMEPHITALPQRPANTDEKSALQYFWKMTSNVIFDFSSQSFLTNQLRIASMMPDNTIVKHCTLIFYVDLEATKAYYQEIMTACANLTHRLTVKFKLIGDATPRTIPEFSCNLDLQLGRLSTLEIIDETTTQPTEHSSKPSEKTHGMFVSARKKAHAGAVKITEAALTEMLNKNRQLATVNIALASKEAYQPSDNPANLLAEIDARETLLLNLQTTAGAFYFNEKSKLAGQEKWGETKLQQAKKSKTILTILQQLKDGALAINKISDTGIKKQLAEAYQTFLLSQETAVFEYLDSIFHQEGNLVPVHEELDSLITTLARINANEEFKRANRKCKEKYVEQLQAQADRIKRACEGIKTTEAEANIGQNRAKISVYVEQFIEYLSIVTRPSFQQFTKSSEQTTRLTEETQKVIAAVTELFNEKDAHLNIKFLSDIRMKISSIFAYLRSLGINKKDYHKLMKKLNFQFFLCQVSLISSDTEKKEEEAAQENAAEETKKSLEKKAKRDNRLASQAHQTLNDDLFNEFDRAQTYAILLSKLLRVERNKTEGEDTTPYYQKLLENLKCIIALVEKNTPLIEKASGPSQTTRLFLTRHTDQLLVLYTRLMLTEKKVDGAPLYKLSNIGEGMLTTIKSAAEYVPHLASRTQPINDSRKNAFYKLFYDVMNLACQRGECYPRTGTPVGYSGLTSIPKGAPCYEDAQTLATDMHELKLTKLKFFDSSDSRAEKARGSMSPERRSPKKSPPGSANTNGNPPASSAARSLTATTELGNKSAHPEQEESGNASSGSKAKEDEGELAQAAPTAELGNKLAHPEQEESGNASSGSKAKEDEGELAQAALLRADADKGRRGRNSHISMKSIGSLAPEEEQQNNSANGNGVDAIPKNTDKDEATAADKDPTLAEQEQFVLTFITIITTLQDNCPEGLLEPTLALLQAMQSWQEENSSAAELSEPQLSTIATLFAQAENPAAVAERALTPTHT